MYSIYQFKNLKNNNVMFIGTKDVNNLIKNCNNDELIQILNSKYIYQLVFADIQKHRINELINSVKNNNIKLTKSIIDTKNKQDYLLRKQLGENNEHMLKPIIESVFGLNLTKTTNQYSHFDFYDKNLVVELKSLNISNNVFVGVNKIVCNNILFIFKCNKTNDLYYLQYNRELFTTIPIIETEMKLKSTLSRSYSIPIRYLTRFFATDKIELLFEFDEVNIIHDLID